MANWAALGQMADSAVTALGSNAELRTRQKELDRQEKMQEAKLAQHQHEQAMRDLVTTLDIQVKQGQLKDMDAVRTVKAKEQEFALQQMKRTGEAEAMQRFVIMAKTDPAMAVADFNQNWASLNGEDEIDAFTPEKTPDGKLAGTIKWRKGSAGKVHEDQVRQIYELTNVPATTKYTQDARVEAAELKAKQAQEKLDADTIKWRAQLESIDAYRKGQLEQGEDRNTLGWNRFGLDLGDRAVRDPLIAAQTEQAKAGARATEAGIALTGAKAANETAGPVIDLAEETRTISTLDKAIAAAADARHKAEALFKDEDTDANRQWMDATIQREREARQAKAAFKAAVKAQKATRTAGAKPALSGIAAPAATATQTGNQAPSVIRTQEEYNALPPGALFIDAQEPGKVHRKAGR